MYAPDIHNIRRINLKDNKGLPRLYMEFVRRELWPNTAADVLLFWSLAEMALRDGGDTPGARFYDLVTSNKASSVSADVEAEAAAQARISSAERDALAKRTARGPLPEPEPLGPEQHSVFGQHIVHSHAPLIQCFLPQKAVPVGRTEWQVKLGKACAFIKGGWIASSDNRNTIQRCSVPSGVTSRLIISYIIGYAIRHKTPVIDLGNSLREFMRRLKVPIGATEGEALFREIQNIAAARFYLGIWTDEYVATRFMNVAGEFTHSRSGSEIRLERGFHEAIQHRHATVDMSRLATLRESPRRMDLYCWLSYRLSAMEQRKSVTVPLRHLQPLFAPGVASPRDFRQTIKRDLQAICRLHSGFKVTLKTDALQLAA